MSLINEALKRNEQQPRPESSPLGYEPPVHPADDGGGGRRSKLGAVLAVGGIFIAAGVIGLFAVTRSSTPQRLTASVQRTHEPADRSSPQAILANTRRAVNYFHPEAAPRPDASSAQPTAEPSLLARLTQAPKEPSPPDSPVKQPTAEDQPTTQPATADSAPTTQPLHDEPSSQPTAVADQTPLEPTLPPLDPKDYTVSALIHGPGGSRAIINGQPVRVGQQVGETTVVRIHAASVELERGDERITVKM